MATQTRQVAALYDGAVVVTYDFDDVTGDLLAIRCVNGRGRGVRVVMQGTGGGVAGRVRDTVFTPGTRTESIPVAERARLPVVTNSRGVVYPSNYFIRVDV